MEGRRLVPDQPLPPKTHRLLYSAFDVNNGEWVYHCRDHGEGGVVEPDLLSLLRPDDVRPYILTTWVMTNNPTNHSSYSVPQTPQPGLGLRPDP